ncbi:MAG: glycosyltransferase [Desulfobulbaceae bacterium]|nr:glycosyltransferase [Desulfobulbaceae bacterium]
MNERRHLPRLLYGISQQTINNFEIIAVDSGSTDGTIEILNDHRIKTISLNPDSFSFGRSCNIGCKEAEGEIFIFVSAHAYPIYRTWLEELIKPFCDPLVGISYGKQRGNESSNYSECQIFKSWYPDEDQSLQDHPFCNNANNAIRRNLWEELYFDEVLTGLEDIDFAKRARDRNYKISYVAAAEVVHVHEEIFSAVFNRYRREALAYRTIFPHERLSGWQIINLFFRNLKTDCSRAWAENCFFQNLKDILSFRLMQFCGTYLGMKQHGPVTDSLRQRFYYPNRSPVSHRSIDKIIDVNSIEYHKIFEND